MGKGVGITSRRIKKYQKKKKRRDKEERGRKKEAVCEPDQIGIEGFQTLGGGRKTDNKVRGSGKAYYSQGKPEVGSDKR